MRGGDDQGAGEAPAAAGTRQRPAGVSLGRILLSDPPGRLGAASFLTGGPAERETGGGRSLRIRQVDDLPASRLYDPRGAACSWTPSMCAKRSGGVRASIAMVNRKRIFAASARDNLRTDWTAEANWGSSRGTPMPKHSCALYPTGWTPSWAKAARACPAGSGSESPLAAPCSAGRPCCCSTKRQARSTRKVSGWFRMPSSG